MGGNLKLGRTYGVVFAIILFFFHSPMISAFVGFPYFEQLIVGNLVDILSFSVSGQGGT